MSWIIIVVFGVLAVAAASTFYKGRRGQRDVSQTQLLEWMEQGSNLCILDVRTAGEYASGRIPGAINISHEEVSAHLDELTAHQSKNIVVYCQRGGRARMAQDTLAKAGFPNVYHLTGDMAAWCDAGRPIEAARK